MQLQRFATNPIITPALDGRIGTNINGPSLICAPAWLPNPLGKYYLYFAHHHGESIRLAYSDDLAGPWRVYGPGTLQLHQTPCTDHIASPDVHVDEANQQIIMYYHGPTLAREAAATEPITQRFPFLGGQRSFVATSRDGINFVSQTEILGVSYLRVFRWQEYTYALGMPGIFYRSRDGFTDFVQGPICFNRNMRHSALWQQGDQLAIFYSEVGDCPEHIKVAQLTLTADWQTWQPTAPTSVLLPELPYEGAGLPLAPSARGAVEEPVCQLRDPAIYHENGRVYLLYSVAGESGLALAEITARGRE